MVTNRFKSILQLDTGTYQALQNTTRWNCAPREELVAAARTNACYDETHHHKRGETNDYCSICSLQVVLQEVDSQYQRDNALERKHTAVGLAAQYSDFHQE